MLRKLDLKLEYCSDTDDIVQDFFFPCFSNCVKYDRCVDIFSVETLFTMAHQFENFVSGKTQIRLIVGHRLGARDISILTKYLTEPACDFDHNNKMVSKVCKMMQQRQIMIRIAIPSFDESSGEFSQRLGIFGDQAGDVVAFTGTSKVSFYEQQRDFESVDVFTSWNDPERVKKKISNFQELWDDKTENVRVYDFDYADRNNLLKYSSEWAIHR